jgi:hypothetical protein
MTILVFTMGKLGLTRTTGQRGFSLGLGYQDHFWRSVARQRYFLVRRHRLWRGGMFSFERDVRLRRRRKCRCLYPVYLCPEAWLHPSDLSVRLGPELVELGLKESAYFVRASQRPRDLCLNLVWELSCEFVLYTARCLGGGQGFLYKVRKRCNIHTIPHCAKHKRRRVQGETSTTDFRDVIQPGKLQQSRS